MQNWSKLPLNLGVLLSIVSVYFWKLVVSTRLCQCKRSLSKFNRTRFLTRIIMACSLYFFNRKCILSSSKPKAPHVFCTRRKITKAEKDIEDGVLQNRNARVKRSSLFSLSMHQQIDGQFNAVMFRRERPYEKKHWIKRGDSGAILLFEITVPNRCLCIHTKL